MAKYYTVKSGDSLNQIAVKENVSFKDIVKMNNIESPYVIKVGQKLKLSIDKPTEKE